MLSFSPLCRCRRALLGTIIKYLPTVPIVKRKYSIKLALRAKISSLDRSHRNGSHCENLRFQIRTLAFPQSTNLQRWHEENHYVRRRGDYGVLSPSRRGPAHGRSCPHAVGKSRSSRGGKAMVVFGARLQMQRTVRAERQQGSSKTAAI